MLLKSGLTTDSEDTFPMTIDLSGEVVVITGGALRVGREIALACARAGAQVAISYHRSELAAQSTLDELRVIGSEADKCEIGASKRRFEAYRCEVSRADDVEQLAQSVARDFGAATVLINNAAIFRRTPFATLTESDFDDHIAANLKGPYLLCKRFGDDFLKCERGHIINLADIYGSRPLRNYLPYCLSKAGVVMLTQVLALALAPNVRVNAIAPGTIMLPSEPQGEGDSEAQLLPRIPLQRLGTAQEIARTVVFLIGGPGFISGAIVPVDGAQRLR